MKKISRRRFLKTIGFSSAGVVGLTGYGLAVEPGYRLNVTRYNLSPHNWTPGLNLSIGVIADVHAGGPLMPAERIRAIAERTNALKPDIIVLLGDFAASHKFKTRSVAPEEWADALSILRAPLGVHAILGNHDWWDDLHAQRAGEGPVHGRRVLEAVGIPVYENDVVRLDKSGHPFWLAGLGDQLAFVTGRRKRAFRRFEGVDDLPGTLAKVTDDAPVVLLAHEPDIFTQVPDRVSLTLSGHTHGGQVRLFGYSPRVPSRFGNRFAYGHIIEGNRNLIVSGGLGCSILPVRIGVPPEIVMVHVSA
ncbi:MAG: metallophosphoesterase [Hyphomonadaceae bacterium]|nr:metallophosphoesterase [Hyphomonadaceae bacterium]